VPSGRDLLFFPVIVAVQLVFTLALALIVAALTVHFRDIRDLLSNLLTFWFFATPIIYFYELPTVQSFRRLFDLNPFFHLAVSYQEVLFFSARPGAPPFWAGHLAWLIALGAGSCALFVLAYWLFDRLRDSFAEVV
jgi:ABC-type polysaccharide/polyol phosphate export permease